MFVYELIGRHYEVGHYDRSGNWCPAEEYQTGNEAAERCHWLNGGDIPWSEYQKRKDAPLGVPTAQPIHLEKFQTDPIKVKPKGFTKVFMSDGRLELHNQDGCMRNLYGRVEEIDEDGEIMDTDVGMYVRLHSWDDSGDHVDMMRFKNRKVKVTVEVVE